MIRFNNSGQIAIPLIIVLIAVASFTFVGGLSKHNPKPLGSAEVGIPQPKGPVASENNLQLELLEFQKANTPTPQITQTPTNSCSHDTGSRIAENPDGSISCTCAAYLIRCENLKCVEVLRSNLNPNGSFSCEGFVGNGVGFFENWCGNPYMTGDGDGVYCVGKPVIYLYPEKPTYVNVEVKTPGEIVVSDPTYPAEGWQQVLATPNGTLHYEDKLYRELFYETNVKEFIKPTNGIIISQSKLQEKLDDLIKQLGLEKGERKEFLDFWVPRLRELNSPYIVFSVLGKQEKEAIDRVIINPKPDTRIEFIAYFKPIYQLQPITPLKLDDRPKRIGFTAVEWGGILDDSNILK